MLIKVKVFPNSKKRKVIEKSENSFEIGLRPSPKEEKQTRRR